MSQGFNLEMSGRDYPGGNRVNVNGNSIPDGTNAELILPNGERYVVRIVSRILEDQMPRGVGLNPSSRNTNYASQHTDELNGRSTERRENALMESRYPSSPVFYERSPPFMSQSVPWNFSGSISTLQSQNGVSLYGPHSTSNYVDPRFAYVQPIYQPPENRDVSAMDIDGQFPADVTMSNSDPRIRSQSTSHVRRSEPTEVSTPFSELSIKDEGARSLAAEKTDALRPPIYDKRDVHDPQHTSPRARNTRGQPPASSRTQIETASLAGNCKPITASPFSGQTGRNAEQMLNPRINVPLLPVSDAPKQPSLASTSLGSTMAENTPDEDRVGRLRFELKKGRLPTKKKELTFLIVGETGVGKTSFLSLIVNTLEGRSSSDYRITHDLANEAGGSKNGSQTNSARLYEFSSLNGVKVRILDTPGLADTRGIAFDKQHKTSIAKTIQDSVPAVDGVLIIANGTTERLQVATDYALTTLSSIFPRSIASNISIVFTMISNPMAFNFQMESLPDCLQDIETFNLDNPIALRKKYEEIREKPKYAKQAKAMKKLVGDAHDAAVQMLAEFFDWLDKCEVQPTTAIVDLYRSVCEIDLKIVNALTRMNHMAEKKRDLEQLRVNMSHSEQSMKLYENFQSIMQRKIKVQTDTTYHNTICIHPNCYSNCHIDCSLSFSLDPEIIGECSAFDGYDPLKCIHCQHPTNEHRHYHAIWEDAVEQQIAIDENARSQFTVASNDRLRCRDSMNNVQSAIDALDDEILGVIAEVGHLCNMYKELSLSGNFAGQISKSIRLFELNLENLQANGADTNTIQAVLASVKIMKEKERDVRNAGEAMKRKVKVVASRPGGGSQR